MKTKQFPIVRQGLFISNKLHVVIINKYFHIRDTSIISVKKTLVFGEKMYGSIRKYLQKPQYNSSLCSLCDLP